MSELTQNALVKIIKKLSYREGDFTLASGKKSTFYIDLKSTTLHPHGAQLVGELGFRTLNDWAKKQGVEIGAVGGLTLGADPIATAVSLAAWSHGTEWPAFIVRKESKDHGTLKYVEGSENLKKHFNLAVVEDVCTTGGSSLKAVEKLRLEGYLPKVVLTVVDREQGGREAIEKEGLAFLSLCSIRDLTGRDLK